MPNSKDVFNHLLSKIFSIENRDEIRSIVFLLLNNLTGLTQTQILAGKEMKFIESSVFDQIVSRINDHEPIQYILGQTDFYGRTFMVNRSVLIPRPETEQLIEEALMTSKNFASQNPSILDIGTGSGCIAITLAMELPKAQVFATDVSAAALETAKANALKHNAAINFINNSVLADPPAIASADMIVSNPPYITLEEQTKMDKNVLDFEPALALFVPQDEPLIFYKAIAQLAQKILTPKGMLIVEINERFGKEVVDLFSRLGFEGSIHRDINNKERIVTASRAR